jgi:hypothetical protein
LITSTTINFYESFTLLQLLVNFELSFPLSVTHDCFFFLHQLCSHGQTFVMFSLRLSKYLLPITLDMTRKSHDFQPTRKEPPSLKCYIATVSNSDLRYWCLPSMVITVIQGDQKVSVRLMITIQIVTSNVQSVPRHSPDIY